MRWRKDNVGDKGKSEVILRLPVTKWVLDTRGLAGAQGGPGGSSIDKKTNTFHGTVS
jgi:hypothetical protein